MDNLSMISGYIFFILAVLVNVFQDGKMEKLEIENLELKEELESISYKNYLLSEELRRKEG